MIALSKLLASIAMSAADFSDDVVVVTGAGRGIGLQTAKAFALLGARVVSAEIEESGKETENEFNQLPIFVRPLARQGFKTKSRKSILEWQRQISSLTALGASIPATIKPQLQALAAY